MFRFGYLILRLSVILVICLLLRFGFDPVLRVALARVGASTFGAKVDVRRVRTSIGQAHLYLGDVEIADRRRPLKNLVEFDGAWIALDSRALLEKRVVIPHAVIDGIELNTDRIQSGALDELGATEGDSIFAGISERISSEASRRAEDWFADLESRLEADLRSEVQSIGVTEDIIQWWREEVRQVDREAEVWRRRVGKYRELVQLAKENPLRGIEALNEGLIELQATHNDIVAAQQTIRQWRRQLQADKQSVDAAKVRDLERLRELTRVENIDPEALTEYLLGDELSRRLELAVSWMGRIRQLTDHLIREPEINEQQGRGVNIPLVTAQGPDFLVERLSFSGRGEAAGSYSFVGHATDIAVGMQKMDRPTVVEFSSDGPFAAHVRTEIFSAGETPLYRIRARLPQLVQPAYELGDAGHLAVRVAPGLAALWVDVQFDGPQVQGDIRWRQDDLTLTPALAGVQAEGIRAGVEAAFAQVQHLHARVEVRGSRQSPQWNLSSNLGNDLSAGLQTAATGVLQQFGGEFVVRLDAEIADRLAEVDQMLQARETSLSEILRSLQGVSSQPLSPGENPLKRLGTTAARLLR